MDLSSYLERIGYRGAYTASADTLRQIQSSHMLAVPFENLSIHAGEPIVLEEPLLYEKIVTHRRGGFCYELNGLLAWALRQFGFEVEMLSAGVLAPSGVYGEEFDHMVLVISLEKRWLVDVGFGDSFREPLLMDCDGEQSDGHCAYRLGRDDGGYRVLMKRDTPESDWRVQFRFGMTPHELNAYSGMCRFHQTSPESFFTKSRLCSLAKPDGRITLSGLRLISTKGGVKQERELANEAEYDSVLRDTFGIVMK